MASGKITKRTIDALIASRSEGFLWDDGIKGFGAKITKSGAVSYILQFRMGGREARTRRCTIGSHGSPWTPTTAREEALRLSLLIAQGVDPVEVEKQRRREEVDLAFDNYADRFERSCVGHGWKLLVARSLRIHALPVLKSKPLTKITRPDVVAVFDRMPGTQVANRRNVFAVLRRLFRWAVSRGDIDRSPMESMETPPAVRPAQAPVQSPSSTGPRHRLQALCGNGRTSSGLLLGLAQMGCGKGFGWQHLGSPIETAMVQPGGGKAGLAMRFHQFGDAELVSFRRGGGEGERDFAQTQLEQPVAARRLAVIIALGGGAREDFDLPVIETKAAIDAKDLRLDRALVGQEYPCRAAAAVVQCGQ